MSEENMTELLSRWAEVTNGSKLMFYRANMLDAFVLSHEKQLVHVIWRDVTGEIAEIVSFVDFLFITTTFSFLLYDPSWFHGFFFPPSQWP